MRQGVTKVAGRISNIASGVMSSLQVGHVLVTRPFIVIRWTGVLVLRLYTQLPTSSGQLHIKFILLEKLYFMIIKVQT